MGLVTGPSLDLTTVDEAGNPWGFAKTSMRQKALRLIDQEQPLVVVVSGRAGGGQGAGERRQGAHRGQPQGKGNSNGKQGKQQGKRQGKSNSSCNDRLLVYQSMIVWDPCLSKKYAWRLTILSSSEVLKGSTGFFIFVSMFSFRGVWAPQKSLRGGTGFCIFVSIFFFNVGGFWLLRSP